MHEIGEGRGPRAPRLTLLVATLLLLASRGAHAQAVKPPNVVLVIADDLGWPYVGFMGHPIVETPNIDALAAGGTVFTNAHNLSSTCAPSLRTLLAGVHSNEWDLKRGALKAALGPLPLRTEVAHYRTLPRELARRGYLSWEGGKLWSGTFLQAGFTHGLATSIARSRFSSVGDDFGRTGWTSGTELAPLQTFLDAAGDRPFFLWLAPMLPHVPLNAPLEFRAPYAGLGLPANEALYYANISWFDALLGAFVAEIERRGLRDNTLIVLVSDNGYDVFHQLAGTGTGKGTLHELGFRTPLVLNWPGRIPAGVERDDLISTLDVPATILDYAGAEPSLGRGGRSLKSAVESGSPIGLEKLVSGFGGGAPRNTGYYVRTQVWRYITANDGTEELYEIAIDPFEERDVAGLHPELLPGFRTDVADWKAQATTAPQELEAAGRLTDALGQPIAGEEIRLSGRSKARKPLRLRVLTSDNGDFFFSSVPQGRYHLRSRRGASLTFARFRGRIPVSLPVGTLGSYVAMQEVQPSPPKRSGRATISGTVRSRSGQPIAGTVVMVRTGAVEPIVVMVRTNADGLYRAENLPGASYRVAVKPEPGRGRAIATVELAQDTDATVDLATTGS